MANITNVNATDFNNQFGDLIGSGGNPPLGAGLQMGRVEDDFDLTSPNFGKNSLSSTTENTTLPAAQEQFTEEQRAKADGGADLLSTEDEKNKEAALKYDFSDISGYIENRVKEGKFIKVEVEDETDTNKIVDFVPKTPEEFDQFLEFQVNYKLEEAKKEIDKTWFESKSPAFRFIAQYAETIDDPSALLPMLQGINTLQTVANIDENELHGAEQIVRISLSKSGQPTELIDTQVEALKTTDKILEHAARLKPAMIKSEQAHLAKIQQEEQRRFAEYNTLNEDIRRNSLKVIDAPIGKEKLKEEEKYAIYELISQRDQETKGYPIFDKIDDLYEKKDFNSLKEVALLLTHREAFIKYLTSGAVENVAEGLQRKLRAASSNRNTGHDNDGGAENTHTIQRNSFNSKPIFSR